MDIDWTFAGWSRIGFVVLAAVAAYAWVVVVLRAAGKRSLAKLNAFDFVVTVALGSLLATAVVSRSVALIEAVVALAGLATVQALVSWAAARVPSLRRHLTNTPTAVLVDGVVRKEVLHRERLRVDEVAQAVRADGRGSLGEVALVVLETDGSLSVIADVGDGSALVGVEGVADARPPSPTSDDR